MKLPYAIIFSSGTALLLILLLIHITQGQAELDISTVFTAIFAPNNSAASNIVRYIRLPRSNIGILVGAALGI